MQKYTLDENYKVKNIIARGGIEFLGVLFWITGSFFIEDKNNARELNAQLYIIKWIILSSIDTQKVYTV